MKTAGGGPNPPAQRTTSRGLNDLRKRSADDFFEFVTDRKDRKLVSHRLDAVGYTRVRNPDDKSDGHWKIGGQCQTIYALSRLTERERIIAAQEKPGR
jgi:hypothetical protein